MQVAEDLQSDWYRNKIPPVYHLSKEVMRSYYLGWVVKKESHWSDALNSHILKIQEVIVMTVLFAKLKVELPHRLESSKF